MYLAKFMAIPLVNVHLSTPALVIQENLIISSPVFCLCCRDFFIYLFMILHAVWLLAE